MTRAIVELSRTLGLSIVAEGVEHASQAAERRELGCEHAQGLLWSRPVEAAAFPAAVRRLGVQLRPGAMCQAGAAGPPRTPGDDPTDRVRRPSGLLPASYPEHATLADGRTGTPSL